jgi:hypothetical protein
MQSFGVAKANRMKWIVKVIVESSPGDMLKGENGKRAIQTIKQQIAEMHLPPGVKIRENLFNYTSP